MTHLSTLSPTVAGEQGVPHAQVRRHLWTDDRRFDDAVVRVHRHGCLSRGGLSRGIRTAGCLRAFPHPGGHEQPSVHGRCRAVEPASPHRSIPTTRRLDSGGTRPAREHSIRDTSIRRELHDVDAHSTARNFSRRRGREGQHDVCSGPVDSTVQGERPQRSGRQVINDRSQRDQRRIERRGIEMPANIRITRAAEDAALDLALATRGTEYEQAARINQRYVRVSAGLLRIIESLARDGMITGNSLGEYGDVLSLFASPVVEQEEAAVATN